ncbi:unnamed protein product, partial [Rotaria socialis]
TIDRHDRNILLVDYTDAQIESETDKLPFQFKHLQGPIPSGTREFSISIGADIEKANVMSVDEPYCVIDRTITVRK